MMPALADTLSKTPSIPLFSFPYDSDYPLPTPLPNLLLLPPLLTAVGIVDDSETSTFDTAPLTTHEKHCGL
jgi:hypothetical protein